MTAINDADRVTEILLNRCFENENGCWIWTGHTKRGYGMIRYFNRITNVMRVAAHLYMGMRLKDLRCVFHRHHYCPQTCFNPDHLQITLRRNHGKAGQRRGNENVHGPRLRHGCT